MAIFFRDNFIRQLDAWIVPVDETRCWVRVRGFVPAIGDRMDLMWPKGTTLYAGNGFARACLCTVNETDGRWALVETPPGAGDPFLTQSAIASNGVLQSRAGESFCSCTFDAGPNSLTIKRVFRNGTGLNSHYQGWQERVGYGTASLFWAGGRRRGMRIENTLNRWGWTSWYSPEPTGQSFGLSFSGGEGDELPPPGTPIIASPEIMAHAWPYSSPVAPIYRVESGDWTIAATSTVEANSFGMPLSIHPQGPRALLGSGESPMVGLLCPFLSPSKITGYAVAKHHQTICVGFANYRLEVHFAGIDEPVPIRLYGPSGLLAEVEGAGLPTLTFYSLPSAWPGVYYQAFRRLYFTIEISDLLVDVYVNYGSSYYTRQFEASAAELEIQPGPGYRLGGTSAGDPLRFNYLQIETID